jgi:nitric-oxide synthase
MVVLGSAESIVLEEAQDYLRVLEAEGAASVPRDRRLREIEAEIASRSTYRQSVEELSYGAKLAWRNSVRCVGRKYWPCLSVRDCRHLKTAEEVFAALVEHLRGSTNGGWIAPMISVFAQEESGRPGIRIWNEQLIRYAGYRQLDSSILGDPSQARFTDLVRALGWPGGAGTRFDVLPLVIQGSDGKPRLFEIPDDAILEVQICHPAYPWFAGLGLRWHALPAISNMLLEVGGVRYPAAPFSGWYMLTEVATRNFADASRYNMLPVVAHHLGLDTRREDNLWRDRALFELNLAVLHSFREANVRMVDHHTATRHFVEFEKNEQEQGRRSYAEWSWIVPPLASSVTPVYHRHYENLEIKPNFLYQPEAWASGCPFHRG